VNPERVIVERALANETSKKAVVFYLNFRVTFLNLILEAINLKLIILYCFFGNCAFRWQKYIGSSILNNIP
jgi:hypothetical protein